MSDLRTSLENLVAECREVARYVYGEGSNDEADSFEQAIKEAEAALVATRQQEVGSGLRNADIDDVWISVVASMPDADERSRRIAFARAIQSIKSADL